MNSDNLIETDILVIGGGPAGLAFSIHYADLIFKHNKSAEADPNIPHIPLKVMVL